MPLLTTSQCEKAIICNEFYSLTSSGTFPPAPFTGLDSRSADLAAAVARWQRDHALYIDGILGPKTVAAVEGRKWQPPQGENYVIVGGEKVPTKFPVVHWTQPGGISFQKVVEVMPDWNGLWQREDPSIDAIDRFVLHWDEAVSSHDCFHILIYRNLSVQFCLDSDGTLYQTMDLLKPMARHARWTNNTSIGIEICNPTFLTQAFGVANRAIIQAPKPHTGDPSWRHFDYTPVQKEMICMLVPGLCDIMQIPRRLPRDESGEVPNTLIPDPTSYRGVLGHYHLQTDKQDPGYILWPLLSKVL